MLFRGFPTLSDIYGPKIYVSCTEKYPQKGVRIEMAYAIRDQKYSIGLAPSIGVRRAATVTPLLQKIKILFYIYASLG